MFQGRRRRSDIDFAKYCVKWGVEYFHQSNCDVLSGQSTPRCVLGLNVEVVEERGTHKAGIYKCDPHVPVAALIGQRLGRTPEAELCGTVNASLACPAERCFRSHDYQITVTAPLHHRKKAAGYQKVAG